MKPLIAVDADVLGRRRTGDETYVAALLRELAPIADEERIVAITRRPELVPDGIEAFELPARSQVARMAVRSPPRAAPAAPLARSLHLRRAAGLPRALPSSPSTTSRSSRTPA